MYIAVSIALTLERRQQTFFAGKRSETLRSRTPTLTGGECQINSLFKA